MGVRVPCRELGLRFKQRGKSMTRQALTPERGIQGFADRVFDMFARPAEVELHANPLGPGIERGRGELRSDVVSEHPNAATTEQLKSGHGE